MSRPSPPSSFPPLRWSWPASAPLEPAAGQIAPLIRAEDVCPIAGRLDFWDFWPVMDRDGDIAELGGGLWMALCAPRRPDPEQRHNLARIHLLRRTSRGWRDCGPALPDGFSPGSREWSGSAYLEGDGRRVRLYFTAAGVRGEASASLAQRIYSTAGGLGFGCDGQPSISGWSPPFEALVADDLHYRRILPGVGHIGLVKGLRDPFWFRDPVDGGGYLLFTGSACGPASNYDGLIGIARTCEADASGRFATLPPLVDATGFANELERPHMIHRQGRYYLFWSTQRSQFAPVGPRPATGLYGAVANRIGGPYQLLNGTGLVIANPPEEPRQAYAWQVLNDLSVTSFIDFWGLQGRDPAEDAGLARRQFGGAPAPLLRLDLNGAVSTLL